MESHDLIYGCVISPEHIDGLGHLHYTHYAEYFDIGREALQHQFGISDVELATQGIGLVVTSWEIRHVGEVLPNARVEVNSRLVPYGRGARFSIEQEMYVDGNLVATEKIENVFTKKRNGKRIPVRPPAEFIRKIEKEERS